MSQEATNTPFVLLQPSQTGKPCCAATAANGQFAPCVRVLTPTGYRCKNVSAAN